MDELKVGDWVYINYAYKEWYIKITSFISEGKGHGYGFAISNDTISVYSVHQSVYTRFGFKINNWTHASLPLIDESIEIPELGLVYIKELLQYLADR